MKRHFKKIVCVDHTGIDEFVEADLKSCCEELVIYQDFPQDEEEIVFRMQGADAVFVSWNTRITADILVRCKDLNYVGMCCSLYDEKSANVDIAKARELGIEVRGVRDYGDDGVVEFIISELVQLALGTNGIYLNEEPEELKSLHLGIIGMGAVGRKLADAAAYFGMQVSYYSRNQKEDLSYLYLSLPQLLEECDVISLHLPRNTVLLGKEEFQQMGNQKVIVSSGLGYAYDKEAFDSWIANEKNFAIMDAGTIDEAFRIKYENHPHVLFNSRVSGFTKNARARLADKVIDQVKAYLQA